MKKAVVLLFFAFSLAGSSQVQISNGVQIGNQGGSSAPHAPVNSIQIAASGLISLNSDPLILIDPVGHTINVGTLGNHVTIGAVGTSTNWTFDTTTPATAAASLGIVPPIANIQTTVGTTAIAANTCTSGFTATMTGVLTTSVFAFTPTTDTSGVTGWGATGGLVITAWPTANTLNYKVCNQTTASITPSGSVIFNVGAR